MAGDHKKAILCFKKDMESNPKNANNLESLGLLRADKFCNFLIYPLIAPRVRELPSLSSRVFLNCSKELYFFIFVDTGCSLKVNS